MEHKAALHPPLDASAYVAPETPAERVLRLYQHPGGPLIGWLLDDAARRRHDDNHLAHVLGISLEELERCKRGQAAELVMDRAFMTKAARYLAIPPITARLLAGDIRVGDFATRIESPTDTIEREFARMLTDPKLRALVPDSVANLTDEYRHYLVMVYGKNRAMELAELPLLPDILRWLQRAAIQHDEHEAMAAHAAGTGQGLMAS